MNYLVENGELKVNAIIRITTYESNVLSRDPLKLFRFKKFFFKIICRITIFYRIVIILMDVVKLGELTLVEDYFNLNLLKINQLAKNIKFNKN